MARVRAVLFDIDGTLLERRSHRLLRHLHDVGPVRGARVLVDRLRSRGLICCAVSRSSNEEVHDLLHAAGIHDLIDVLVTGEDDHASTHGLEIALERVGVSASEAVYVADTPADVALGRRAGVAVIALRCGGGYLDRDFDGAAAIYDDPEDLSFNLDRSPLALDRGAGPEAALLTSLELTV
jgi:beta-phosphoglucomutase-like phosphatase (HAD superfamily)